MKKLTGFLLSLSLVTATGCTVNPVTGESQLSLITPQQEIQIGAQNYLPSQQSQGGAYVVDPEVNVYVRQVGQKLAALSDRPQLPYDFVVLNNDVPNAWALPGGKIAINRGLLVMLKDEAQLAAVLGHEIVHAAARHGASQQTQAILLGLGTQVAQIASQNTAYGEWVTSGSQLGAAAIQAQYGQGQELQSDEYGMEYMSRAGYDPQAAVELQQLFVKLSKGRQSDPINQFFASHPPSQKRVAANQARAKTLSGNIRNKDKFNRVMAKLKKDQPAYDLHQKALEAASKKNFNDALSKVDRAIKIAPSEALFWQTRGRLLQAQKKPSEATKAYDKAIRLNPEYFQPYLLRGLVRVEQNNTNGAVSDLQLSQKYLDTQISNFYLGELMVKKGLREQAITYYQKAQRGGGDLGQQATSRLEKLQTAG